MSHEIITLYQQGHTQREISRLTGIPKSTINYRIQKYRKDIGDEGSDVSHVKGTSTLYDAEGNPKLRWVKTDKSKEDAKEIIDYAIQALKDVKPLSPVKKIPKVSEDLLACYVLSDYHLGMFAHKEEGGADWDLEIAQEKLNNWIDKAISLSPEADTGLFIQLGDFLHTDGMVPVTPASKHVLDTSARFQKIVAAAINGIKRAISRMLDKHAHVHVIIASANHDPSSSVWMRAMFHHLYENEPRVTIDDTEHPYYCYEWGNTSIFAHHGHMRALKDVSRTFAGLYREVFGRTKYSYGHIGHFHHVEVKEDSLMQVEIHSTLAPKDSHASDYGYHSQRKAKTILYSKEHGEVGTINITPEMI